MTMNKNQLKFPFEDQLKELKANQEDVIWIKGRAYVVKPATVDDIERIGTGYFCLAEVDSNVH